MHLHQRILSQALELFFAFEKSVDLKSNIQVTTDLNTSLFCSSSRCIHAAMIRSAAWEATATALITPRPAASTAAGGRSAAIGMPCAVPGTAAATVRPWHTNAITPHKPSRKPHCSRVRFGNWMSRLMQISRRKWLVPSFQTVLLNVA